jgi:para-aminobenzoate synthetase
MENVLAAVAAASPSAGRTLVVAIDGRSGAGKSTLAHTLAGRLGAPLVSLEDLYGGWDGLEHGVSLLASAVLRPLAAGRAVSVPRYDWEAAAWREPWSLEPPTHLIVEGVGAGAKSLAPHTSVLVWLELDAQTRRDRVLARHHGDIHGPAWERWSLQEDAFYEREHPHDRADIVIEADELGDPAGV